MTSNRKERLLPLLMFLTFLIIGLMIYDDYGIGWDESQERASSLVSYRYLNRVLLNRGVFVNEMTEDISTYRDRYYGVSIQLPLMFIEDVYQLAAHEPMSYTQIYHVRHLYCFFLFLFALYCFYKFLKDLHESVRYAAAGVLMIYTFGRFFAESFYNIKDIVFASLTMITLFCAEKMFRTKLCTKWCLLFAVSAAFLVNSRIIGALFPLIILLLIILESICKHTQLPVKPILLICLSLPIWILITPAAWENPVDFAIGVVRCFASYEPWKGTQLFAGKVMPVTELPFDYYLRWIGMTVPLVYLFFFFCGFVSFVKKTVSGLTFSVEEKIYLLMGSVLVGTLLYQMILRPTVYNGWRHVYFLYPLIISFAVFGFRKVSSAQAAPNLRIAASFLLTVSLLYNAVRLIRNHPGEFLALNPIGQKIGADYHGDYWGLSMFTALRWVAQNTEESVTANINSSRYVLNNNYQMLTEEEKNKVQIPLDITDLIIVWEGIPLNKASYAFEGYELIKSFSYYGQETMRIYRRIGS